MDPETRELRALEAEVAALRRECSMLRKPWEETSGARYVAPVHPSGPRIRAPRGPTHLLTARGSESVHAGCEQCNGRPPEM